MVSVSPGPQLYPDTQEGLTEVSAERTNESWGPGWYHHVAFQGLCQGHLNLI